MSIQKEIELWNGKSANDIGEIYSRHCHDAIFVSKIIEFIGNESLQKGATWLLKRHLENNNHVSEADVSLIYTKLEGLEHWESKLHILQSLPFMPIPQLKKEKVEVFLRKCLIENNKFVRAWAYNGFYELAVKYPEHIKETKRFFEMAMRDEAPSVKSRIRNIMKKGF